MKLRIRPVAPRGVLAVVALGASLSILTGCGEVEAESPSAAFPVGVSAPRSNELSPGSSPVSDTDEQGAVESAPPSPSEPSPEVALGAESTEPAAEDATPQGADPAGDEADDTDPSALGDFRATLDPYGTWADDPTYGTVWVPSPYAVGDDFTPYVSAGHWAYDNDYVWVSEYAWGWAPFHYGRWVYAGGPGWEWVPGRRYAGAWVSWRYGVSDWDYVGWAPLSPTWCWRRGVAVGIGFVPVAPYAFVGTRDLFSPGVRGRVIVGDRVGPVAEHTRPWAPGAAGGAGSGPADRALVGRALARPVVGGPPPSTLGIPQTAVARLDASPRVMQGRAGAFVRPEAARLTAQPGTGFVAHPAPSALVPAPGRYGEPRGSTQQFSRYSQWSPPSRYAQAPISPSRPSHFGGRMGTGFVGSPAVAGPSMGGSAPAYARPYFGPSPQYAASGAAHGAFVEAAPGIRASGGGTGVPAARAYSAPTMTGSAGTFHGGAGFSAGNRASGGVRGGGGGRGGGHR
jgi:hypothetical protein